jgi:hypothetical protein
MEHQLLTQIASNLFENIPVELWHDKSAEEIEVEVQQLVNQVANILLGEFILPERIAQIEERVAEGHTVCAACQQPLRLHKQATTTHAKTIFGGQIELARNQYWCPHCDSYEMVADRVLGFVGHRMTPRFSVSHRPVRCQLVIRSGRSLSQLFAWRKVVCQDRRERQL